jgi:general stress protein 26
MSDAVTTKHIKNYEDVTVYGLDAVREQELIDGQNELTFCWTTQDGSPMAVIMSYVRTDDGHFWMTASGQRKRIPAIRRDPRVALVVTSSGTEMRAGKTVTYKGSAIVHDETTEGWEETKAWFYLALAERIHGRSGGERVREFANMLNSPRRVIVEVVPGLRVGYDGDKMRDATIAARSAGTLQWVD